MKLETYQKMLERWGGGEFSGLVTVTGSEDVTKGGLFFFDEAFCLNHLVEKPSEAQLDELRAENLLKDGETVWYNAGIYIFQPMLFQHTARLEKSPRGEYEFTDALTAMIDAGEPSAWRERAGRWVDVRDPEVLRALQDAAERCLFPPFATSNRHPRCLLRGVAQSGRASGGAAAHRGADRFCLPSAPRTARHHPR